MLTPKGHQAVMFFKPSASVQGVLVRPSPGPKHQVMASFREVPSVYVTGHGGVAEGGNPDVRRGGDEDDVHAFGDVPVEARCQAVIVFLEDQRQAVLTIL